MQYAKYISSTEVQYPTSEEFPGVINFLAHDTALRAKGYCPLNGVPEEQEGKTLHLDTFDYTHATTGRVEPRPVEVPDYDPETGEQTGTHIEWRDTTIEFDASYITVTAYHYEDIPEPQPTYADYDRAMESYLYDTRAARGYTDREPTDYATSSIPRWKQDAVDWADFRDRVMVYGLEILNKFQAGEPVPTLDEFKEHLKTIEIHWTYNVTE